MRRIAPALLAALLAAPALAAPAAQKEGSPFGAIGGGKEPIKIDADRLDVFDRENKAVFAGNVVAVQGDSTIRCSTIRSRPVSSRCSVAACPSSCRATHSASACCIAASSRSIARITSAPATASRLGKYW